MVVGQEDDNFFICRGLLFLHHQPHDFSVDITITISSQWSISLLYSIPISYNPFHYLTTCKAHLHIALCMGALDTKFAFPLTKGWGTRERLNFRVGSFATKKGKTLYLQGHFFVYCSAL